MPVRTIVGIVVFIGLFIGFIIWLFNNRRESYHRAFEIIGKELGGTYVRGEWPFEGKIDLSYAGKNFEIELSQGEKVKGKMILLILHFKAPALRGDIKIKRKGIAKKMRGVEFTDRTGNRDFDSKVEIISEGIDVQQWTMNPEFQQAAIHLVERGYDITAHDNDLKAIKTYAEKPDRSSAVLEADIKALHSIAGYLS